MVLLPIGETARLVGLKTSALRYYDDRGLVRPKVRRGGRRFYGRDELRRLAFIQILQRLGIGLEVAAAVMDHPSDVWRARTREQIAALDALIAQARAARDLLSHALECPSAHPTRECPTMTGLLDRRLAGTSFEELAAEHAHEAPPPPQRKPPARRARPV